MILSAYLSTPLLITSTERTSTSLPLRDVISGLANAICAANGKTSRGGSLKITRYYLTFSSTWSWSQQPCSSIARDVSHVLHLSPSARRLSDPDYSGLRGPSERRKTWRSLRASYVLSSATSTVERSEPGAAPGSRPSKSRPNNQSRCFQVCLPAELFLRRRW
jgi:hypothetical protein